MRKLFKKDDLIGRMKKSVILTIFSLFIVIFLIGILWRIGVFDFGTELSQMSFKELFFKVYIHIIPIMIFDYIAIGIYIYKCWYLKIKNNGMNYINTIISKMKKDLVIAYAILMVVIFLSSLFPVFVSLFVPLTLIVLIPWTVFVFVMQMS